MKIDKKQLIIYLAIFAIIVIVIIAYIISKNENEEINYEELQIYNTKVEDIKITEKIKVHVAGSVVSEGIVELNDGDRIADAIKEAGGTTPDANLKNINLAYKLQDGQKIYIPNTNEEESETALEESVDTGSNSELVNINTATQTELELLSGIGPSLASKIIDYRNKNGKFKNIDELKNVPGIGENKYESIKNDITI